jgi:hypothetical protein
MHLAADAAAGASGCIPRRARGADGRRGGLIEINLLACQKHRQPNGNELIRCAKETMQVLAVPEKDVNATIGDVKGKSMFNTHPLHAS